MPVNREKRLARLHRRIRKCTACPLHGGRRHAVPGEGGLRAEILLLGEAPGEKEDEEGRPFRGRSGRFLDGLMEEIGLSRKALFITSCVKCRPPGNRTPHASELSTCRALWLDQQIEGVDPGWIVLLGRTPMKLLLGEKGALKKLHGQVRPWKGRRLLITYHPAAGMRFPEAGKAMRKDFQKLPIRGR